MIGKAFAALVICRAGTAPVLAGALALLLLDAPVAGARPASGPAGPPLSPDDAGSAAVSVRVAGQASSLTDSDLPLAILLGLEAHHISPTPEAFHAVVGGLERAEKKPLVAIADRGVARLALAERGGLLAAMTFDPRWVLDRARRGGGLPSRPGIIQVWRVAGLALIPSATIGGGELVSSLALRGDARLLAAGSASSPIAKVWTPAGEGGRALRDLGEAIVTAVAFDPGGAALASGDQHGVIRLSREREPRRYVRERMLRYRHQGAVTALAFAPAGARVLASASTDTTAALWRLDGDTPPVFLPHPDAVSALAFSPDGRVLATASRDTALRLWDAGSGDPLGEVRAPVPLSALAFAPDGQRLVVGGADGSVRFYHRGADWSRARPVDPGLAVDRGGVTSLQVSGDGTVLAVGTDRSLLVLDTGLERWAAHACRVAGRNLTGEERARLLPGLPAGPPRCTAAPLRVPRSGRPAPLARDDRVAEREAVQHHRDQRAPGRAGERSLIETRQWMRSSSGG